MYILYASRTYVYFNFDIVHDKHRKFVILFVKKSCDLQILCVYPFDDQTKCLSILKTIYSRFDFEYL